MDIVSREFGVAYARLPVARTASSPALGRQAA